MRSTEGCPPRVDSAPERSPLGRVQDTLLVYQHTGEAGDLARRPLTDLISFITPPREGEENYRRSLIEYNKAKAALSQRLTDANNGNEVDAEQCLEVTGRVARQLLDGEEPAAEEMTVATATVDEMYDMAVMGSAQWRSHHGGFFEPVVD